MGVYGLTSFIKENRRSLCHTLELKKLDVNQRLEDTNLVVDGWSLLYQVFSNSGEPWVYGGEYAALGRHVEAIVSSWLSVGIKPTVVFDGPIPLLKYPTVISRLQENCVKPANIFFRTSPVARSRPRSLAEIRIAPPLGYQALVSTLLGMDRDVKVVLADGEADPCIVALAGQLGAYVTGCDSDFLILNCEGYKGYIPLDEMRWIASTKHSEIHSPDPSAAGEDDGVEFQTVIKKKQKGKSGERRTQMEFGTGLLPPSTSSNSEVSLMLTVYEPNRFAQHVSLPSSLLPLLGALIGNDYASFEFFRFTESAIQRVQRVADTLSGVLREAQSGNSKKIRKVNRGEGSVMDIIGTTVERLLLWRDPVNPPASGQIDSITEVVVQSTLEYTSNNFVSLSQESQAEGSNGPMSSNSNGSDSAEQIYNIYLHAYRTGTLHPRIMEIFTQGSCFPRLFLEDPDRECCARSIGRPVREVIWSVLSDCGGIPEPSQQWEKECDESPEFTDGDDELVDVVEEFSDGEILVEETDNDPLAALRGKLQRLSFSDMEEVPEPIELSQPDLESHQMPISFTEVVRPSRVKVVTDYVRRGARVVGEELEVKKLDYFLPEGWQSAIPVQLRTTEERLKIFLQVLGSDTHSIRELAEKEKGIILKPNRGGKLLFIVALRWVLKTLHARAEALEDGNRKRDRNKEKWTRSEAQAFLACLYHEESVEEHFSIEDRAVQMTAQVLAALEACGWLAQALLLVDLPGQKVVGEDALPMVMGEAEKMFSGRRFHAALRSPRGASGDDFHQLWNAIEEDLGDIFAEEKGKKSKKVNQSNRTAIGFDEVKTPVGMFGVLAGLEAE